MFEFIQRDTSPTCPPLTISLPRWYPTPILSGIDGDLTSIAIAAPAVDCTHYVAAPASSSITTDAPQYSLKAPTPPPTVDDTFLTNNYTRTLFVCQLCEFCLKSLNINDCSLRSQSSSL